MRRSSVNRRILAALCVSALPLTAPAAPKNTTAYDPVGLSAQPRTGLKPARMLSQEEINARLQAATSEPFTPLVFGANDRFYNLSAPGSGSYDLRRYDEWRANFELARAGRSEFAGLDDYDQWFRSIPGAGLEFAWKMQDSYLDGMPPHVKEEYERLMLERAEARSAAAASEREVRAKGLVIASVQCVGTDYVALLDGGRVISAGDLVRSHHWGRDYTWRVERVTDGGVQFSMAGKRWRLSAGERAVVATIVLAAVVLGVLALRRPRTPRPRYPVGGVALAPRDEPAAEDERFPAATNALAIASLVLGILALLIPFNASVLAVSGAAALFGHVVRHRRRPGAAQPGFRGLALAGICLGYIGLTFTALFLYAVWEPACRQNLRAIKQAKEAYIQRYHRAPDRVDDLAPDFMKTPPNCPALGRYTVGAEGENPRCSFPGHRLNADK